MISKSNFTFLLISILLLSCNKTPKGYNYNEGDLPVTPINLTEFNSVYDDYNSTAPTLGYFIPFCFSTNRHSSGGEFDIIYKPMDIIFNKTSGELTIENAYGTSAENINKEYFTLQHNIDNIKTPGNEFGPSLSMGGDSTGIFFHLLYATDISGNFEINYANTKYETTFSEIVTVNFLNSEYDDLYPSFTEDLSEIYFCSNRGGSSFDIFVASIPNSEKNLEIIVKDTSDHIISKNDILSSDYDDKCPLIFGNTLVFTSNRPGGHGGFDLYYSKFINGAWNEPLNFGPSINSEMDEYRPILIDEGVSDTETMMIFSSNREGGLGGFDLYYVGVKLD